MEGVFECTRFINTVCASDAQVYLCILIIFIGCMD